LRKPAPPTAGPERFVDVFVDEFPADLSESRHVVSVDDIDALGASLTDQRGPLVRALAAAHDKHPSA
jgi:hypothetical protein